MKNCSNGYDPTYSGYYIIIITILHQYHTILYVKNRSEIDV